jgi:hypothetical protein
MSNKPLPKPNVEFRDASNTEKMTPEALRAIICNPVYAGIDPYPAIISDADWVNAASQMIKQEGREQFLVNLLYVLRETFKETSE